jgi:hypothetical protein
MTADAPRTSRFAATLSDGVARSPQDMSTMARNRRGASGVRALLGATFLHHLLPIMWLLLIALFGLLVPNGFFVYWLLKEFNGIGPVLADNLALGFMLDVLIVLILLAVYFARHPIGRVKWYWFVVLSFVGGLGFSLPLYYWLNTRR